MRSGFFALLAGAGLFSLTPAFAQTVISGGTCTNASLTGVYSYLTTGRALAATGAFSNILQAVGTANFDGVGSVTITVTANTNQATSQPVYTGTYTVQSNCSGTITVSAGDSGAQYNLVVYNQGNGFAATGEDGTYSFSGSGSLMPAACLTSSLSGQWTFSANAYSIAAGAVTGLAELSGQLQFDGQGNVTTTWNTTTGIISTPATASGTYSVAANCTGTATITDASSNVYSLPLVVTGKDSSDFLLIGSTAGLIFGGSGHTAFRNPGLAVDTNGGFRPNATPPGGIVAIFGNNLATAIAYPPGPLPLPSSVLTTSATINGEALPLFYVSPVQIDAQIPWDIQPGLATVIVTNGATVSNAVAVPVLAAAAGILESGNNHAAVINSDGVTLNSEAAPAHVGDEVTVYFVGGGAVNASGPLVSGQASPPGASSLSSPYSVTVGGIAAAVHYIGLSPGSVGLYQVDLIIPQVAPGDQALSIVINNVASNTPVITVQ
jgi:uncharacterized protein (TIGR03437 family)